MAMPHKDPEARKTYYQEWYAKNKQRKIDKVQEYQRRVPEKRSQWYFRGKRKALQENPKQYLAKKDRYVLKHRCKVVGITIEEYIEYLEKFVNICQICGVGPNGKRLAIDHDHKTGLFRGLLCDLHNRLLGYAQDSPEILASAIKYLQQPPPVKGESNAKECSQ